MAEERLGASFSIDVTNLKAGLKTANKLIKESQSEFKAAAAGLDNWSKSEEGLNAKIKSLNSITAIQEQKVEALKKEYQNLVNNGLDPASDRAVELRTKINQEEAALKSNQAELKKQQQALEDLADSSDEAGDEIQETGEQARKSSDGFTVMKGAIANLVAEGFRKAIQAAKEFTQELVNVGITFDDSMAQVAAVSGATGSDLDRLRDKAKEMGSTTKFTASEAADAFNYMAMAGWKTEEMIGGIDGILNLAAASGTDLATTSDIVTDALTAMGYKAKDAARLADVMAAASSNANTNVEMMGMTFQYAAPIVGALGYNMEDTAVAIGLMANAGIKGEKSGTALRSILTRLSAPPKECAEAMDDLGLSITYSDGTMKSLDTIMRELQVSFSNLSETEQTATAKHLAGAEAMSGLLAIVNAAPEDFNKLTEAVKNADGAATNMADTMLDTLGGDLTILNSQMEGVKLTIFEKLSPALREVVKDIQNVVAKVDWDEFGKKAQKVLKYLINTAKSFSKNVLPTLSKVLQALGKVVKFVIDNFKTLGTAVLVAVTAFKTFKAVLAVTTAIKAVTTAVAGLSAGVGIATTVQTGWNAAMAANPIGAVITAVALLAAGIAALVMQQKKAIEPQELLNEAQRKSINVAKEQAESYRDSKKAADDLASANMANVDYVTGVLIPQLQQVIDKNGEVKAGEEARANFILNELNNALGTEYSSLQDIVDANGQIKDSIFGVIEAKKAQILLEAYEDSYRQAIQNVAQAENARATSAQELATTQELLAQKTEELKDAEEEYNRAIYNGSVNEVLDARKAKQDLEDEVESLTLTLDEAKNSYNDNSQAVRDYYNIIDAYTTASTALTQGETQKAIDTMNAYSGGFQTAASTMKLSAEEQKATLEQQVIDTEINLKLMEEDYSKYSKGMTEEEKAQAEARLENAREQANKAKEEFYKVGGNITKGMADGVEDGTWDLTQAMKTTINAAVEAAKKQADIHSPSKLFRRVIGKMIGLGIAEGVEDSTRSVVKAVKNQVRSIEDAYNLDGLLTSVDAGLAMPSGSGTVNNSKSVVVNQYNTYSQAHSRYELYKSKQQTAAAVRLAMGSV